MRRVTSSGSPKEIVKSIAFDLGDTLIEYEGLPLSWEDRYDAALARLAEFVGCDASEAVLTAARSVLRKYNTRLVPRTREVPFSAILEELMGEFGANVPSDVDAATAAFFSVFRKRLRTFADAQPVLTSLRSAGVRIGVLTDVAYGMPVDLVREDMEAAGVLGFIDELVTSVDAGVRKPATGGLELLASRLQSSPPEMLFVGNEKKDIDVAVSFGCGAILLNRSGSAPSWGQHRTIRSLAELTLPGTLPDGEEAAIV